MVKAKIVKSEEDLNARSEFWSEYLQAAQKFSDVTLVSGDGQQKATHALLLASVSDLLKQVLLDVYSSQERLVILLPDHTMEELELCLQAVLMGEEGAGVERLCQTLGVRVRRSRKDLETDGIGKMLKLVKNENITENTENKIGVSLTRSIYSTKSEYHMINDDSDRGTGDKTLSEDINQPYQCHQCSSLFKNDIGLNMHNSKMHGSGWREYVEKVGTIFKCKLCPKTKKKKSELGIHISRVHKLGTMIMCHNCPEVFFYQNQLETHMLVHSDERRFICDVCGLKLKSANRVRAHKITRHMSEEEKFLRNEKYKCKTCNKKYINRVRLLTHAESHGERIYQCDKCCARFKTKDAQRVHNRRKHLGIKPKQLSEEEIKKKNEIARLYHVKMRLKQKEVNGGVLRKGEERVKFNEYMKNWRAQKKTS